MTDQEKDRAYLIAMLLKGKIEHGRDLIVVRKLAAMKDVGLVRWYKDGYVPTAQGEALMNLRYPPPTATRRGV